MVESTDSVYAQHDLFRVAVGQESFRKHSRISPTAIAKADIVWKDCRAQLLLELLRNRL